MKHLLIAFIHVIHVDEKTQGNSTVMSIGRQQKTAHIILVSSADTGVWLDLTEYTGVSHVPLLCHIHVFTVVPHGIFHCFNQKSEMKVFISSQKISGKE